MIKINKTKTSPEFILDSEKKTAIISGESWPENAPVTYRPLILFVNEMAIGENPSIKIEFNLEYFNTATTKILIALIDILNDFFANGVDIKIIWNIPNGDNDLVDEAEELLEDALFSYEINK